MLRPNIQLKDLINEADEVRGLLGNFEDEALEQAEIQVKYDAYIVKEQELAEKLSHLDQLSIPSNFNYEKILSLSNEARQKFKKIKPETLGQASRISGVNPSDVQMLMIYIGR